MASQSRDQKPSACEPSSAAWAGNGDRDVPQSDALHMSIAQDMVIEQVTVTEVVLGRGHNSVVNQGGWCRQDVAVKTVHHDRDGKQSTLSSRRESISQFATECTTVIGLRHPCVVHCFGVFNAHTSNPALVMEMLDVSLYLRCSNRERHGVLGCREIVSYGMDVLSALSYLHHRGIVHGDLTTRYWACSDALLMHSNLHLSWHVCLFIV